MYYEELPTISTSPQSPSPVSEVGAAGLGGISGPCSVSKVRRVSFKVRLIQEPVSRISDSANRSTTFTETFFDILYVLPVQNLFQVDPVFRRYIFRDIHSVFR
jgi:hypothetical protein